MSCIEIGVLWLSISICRPEVSARRAPAECSSRRSSRIAGSGGRNREDVEVALRHLERARKRLRFQEKEVAEALRIARGVVEDQVAQQRSARELE